MDTRPDYPSPEHLARVPSSRREPSHVSSQGKEAASVTHDICKDWAVVKDKAKSLEHIIWKCDPPTPAMPLVTTGATVPGLYSHITHSVEKDEEEILPLFKGAKLKQTKGRGKPKGKPLGHRQSPPKVQEADEAYTYDNPNNYYHNDNYTAPGQN